MLLCLGPLRTQQSLNKWGLVRLNFTVHKNTGKFASLTKQVYFYLIACLSNQKGTLSRVLALLWRYREPNEFDHAVSRL